MNKNYELIISPAQIVKGGKIKIRFMDRSEFPEGQDRTKNFRIRVKSDTSVTIPDHVVDDTQDSVVIYEWTFDTGTLETGGYFLDICDPADSTNCKIIASGNFEVFIAMDGIYMATAQMAKRDEIGVALKTTDRQRVPDLHLWVSILKSTKSMSFENYETFMDMIFCGPKTDGRPDQRELQGLRHTRDRRFLPFTDTDSYRSLKAATEAFVITNCGVALNDQAFDEDKIEMDLKVERGLNLAGAPPTFKDNWNAYLKDINGEKTIPYLYLVRDKLRDIPLKKHTLDQMLDLRISTDPNLRNIDEGSCFGIISEKLTMPCFLELIWSYWHEESMMVQGINAISRRFQNIRNPRGNNDPLAGIEINPLQPLNNLLWGYIQDEQHRLTVVRRAYEYDHHYGISLEGKAIQDFRPADSRSRFLEAFHQLLYLCAQYYKQEDDLTVKADAFPIRNALREVHLILSEGAHNQYGDLPSTARIEMLMQQYLLARPEFRQVLPTRVMVAYPEPWMDRVSAVNHLMGWTKSSPIHFSNLGIFGEQLLLSIRFGGWSVADTSAEQAAVWANFWRQAVQEYLHAYQAVTGVDLASVRTNNEQIDSRPPSYHLALRAKVSPNGSGNGQLSAPANGKSSMEHRVV